MLARPRTIRPGLRMNVRGRSVKLRGLRRAPVGALRWLAILGPGVIASVGVTRYTVTRYDSGEVQWQRQNE